MTSKHLKVSEKRSISTRTTLMSRISKTRNTSTKYWRVTRVEEHPDSTYQKGGNARFETKAD